MLEALSALRSLQVLDLGFKLRREDFGRPVHRHVLASDETYEAAARQQKQSHLAQWANHKQEREYEDIRRLAHAKAADYLRSFVPSLQKGSWWETGRSGCFEKFDRLRWEWKCETEGGRTSVRVVEAPWALMDSSTDLRTGRSERNEKARGPCR